MIGVLIFAVDARLRRTLEQLSQKDPTIAIVGIADDQSSLMRLAETSHVDVVLTQEMPSAEMFADLRVLHNDRCLGAFSGPHGGARRFRGFRCGRFSDVTANCRSGGNHRHRQDGR